MPPKPQGLHNVTSDSLSELYRLVTELPAHAPLPSSPNKIGPPLRSIQIYTSDEVIANQTEPFIYRNFPWLPKDKEIFMDLISQEDEVYGYMSSPVDNTEAWGDITLTGREVRKRFDNGTLNFNVVDSQCTDQNRILEGWHSKMLIRPPSIGWVLTLAPTITHFHKDPPYGNCFQYLCQGKKIWLLISPEDLLQVESRYGFEIINSLPLPDLLMLGGGILWGKIHIGCIDSRSLLFFPQNWTHYVRTIEPSFGYGGYFGNGQDGDEKWKF